MGSPLPLTASQSTLAAQAAGYDVVRFHRNSATEAQDAIDIFSAQRSVQSNAVAHTSWHPSHLQGPAHEVGSSLDGGKLAVLQVFDGSGERRFDTAAQADAHSQRVLGALELGNKCFSGRGAVRQMAAGHSFALTQHDHYVDGTIPQEEATYVFNEPRARVVANSGANLAQADQLVVARTGEIASKDAIDTFGAQRSVQSNAVAHTSWHPLAQQFSYLRLSTPTGDFKAELVKDYVVRARRIAATWENCATRSSGTRQSTYLWSTRYFGITHTQSWPGATAGWPCWSPARPNRCVKSPRWRVSTTAT